MRAAIARATSRRMTIPTTPMPHVMPWPIIPFIIAKLYSTVECDIIERRRRFVFALKKPWKEAAAALDYACDYER
jgi:hypothetical protein